MSDENEDDGQEVVVEVKTPVLDAIKAEAKEAIDGQQKDGAIRATVVAALVKDEVDRRSALLLKGYKTLLATQEELEKLRPDFKVHVAGSLTEGYTDEQMKKRKAVLKKMAKQNQALVAAVERADYGPLSKI